MWNTKMQPFKNSLKTIIVNIMRTSNILSTVNGNVKSSCRSQQMHQFEFNSSKAGGKFSQLCDIFQWKASFYHISYDSNSTLLSHWLGRLYYLLQLQTSLASRLASLQPNSTMKLKATHTINTQLNPIWTNLQTTPQTNPETTLMAPFLTESYVSQPRTIPNLPVTYWFRNNLLSYSRVKFC